MTDSSVAPPALTSAPRSAAPDLEVLVVFCTFPSEAKALEVAEALVREQLVACVNLVPGVRSVYAWQGALHCDTEALAVCKTTLDRFEALRARLVALHPYELPEVLALPVAQAHAPYLAWVRAQTRGA